MVFDTLEVKQYLHSYGSYMYVQAFFRRKDDHPGHPVLIVLTNRDGRTHCKLNLVLKYQPIFLFR